MTVDDHSHDRPSPKRVEDRLISLEDGQRALRRDTEHLRDKFHEERGERVGERLAKLEQVVVEHTRAHQKRDPLDRITPIVAIIALSGVEAFALHRGADGAMFAPVVALIAAIAGVKMGDTIRDIFGGRK